MPTPDGEKTIQLNSRDSKTIFGVVVKPKPGTAVRAKMETLRNLAYEVVMCDSCYVESARSSPLLSHALQARLTYKPVLTDISRVKWERGSDQFVLCHVLDALGVSGPAFEHVEWQRCLSFTSDHWPTEWAMGLTGGKADRVDVLVKGSLGTVGDCGGDLHDAIVVGPENEIQRLESDYSLVFTIYSLGTYKSVVRSTIAGPYPEARCYKRDLPDVRGRTALMPYGPPGVWHFDKSGELKNFAKQYPLSLLGGEAIPTRLWGDNATHDERSAEEAV